MRILIIEDERKVAAFIQKGLEQEGYAVDVAHDGEEGAYQVENFDYDAAIVDLMLPKLPGLELLRRLRPRFARVDSERQGGGGEQSSRSRRWR